ncbi:hypothetical protein BJF78_00470 [Pseudonocardia sp. CNS-139]|nr:hypothetical protein BJF78_00470 [Pseudonocardia sp. CNS-139]
MQIGFVGLGNMGRGMARNLVRAGFSVTVHDIRPEPVADLVGRGARGAGSPAAAARDADLVCVAVFDEQQARGVLDGEHGVLAGAPAGAVVALHSTLSPAFVRETAASAARTGHTVVDAAMTGGGDVAAEAAELTFMLGGPAEPVARVQPALDVMARRCVHLGDVGAGMAMKIVSNFLGSCNVALVREALRLAGGVGLPAEQVLDVVHHGRVGSSWVSDNWDRIRAQEAGYTTGPQGMVAMWRKDLELAAALGGELDVPAPIARFMLAGVLPDLQRHGLTG